MPSTAVLGQTRNTSHSAGWIFTSHFASTAKFSRQISEKHLVEALHVHNFGFARLTRVETSGIVPSDTGSCGELP
jgi:hypothetical protein